MPYRYGAYRQRSFIGHLYQRDTSLKQTPIESGETPYDGLYREASPERGIFFRLQVYERVEILLVEVVGESVISVCQRAQKN